MSTAVYREDEQSFTENSNFLLLLSFLYLALPACLFAFGWLNTGAALCINVLLIYVGATAWKQLQLSDVSASVRRLFETQHVPFAILLLWCSLSGTGGIGFQNTDYAASNALLKDLIENSWPLRMQNDTPLVYYVVYYLPAALIGKFLGWQIANLVLFTWTYLGLLLIWSLLSIAVRIDQLSPGRKLLAALMFVFFGGMDYFGALLNYGPETTQLGTHLEWWASIGQFSSNTTLLFWVPQHVLAPWLTTSALLLVLKRGSGAELIWCLTALSFLWSPMASLGLLPFLTILSVKTLMTRQYSSTLTVSNFFIGPAIAALAALFYSSNSFQFPTHWQLNNTGFTRNYLLLFALETLAVALPFFSQHLKAKVFLNQINLPPPLKLTGMEKTLGWSAVLILLLLPAYKFGIMNDLCMRASIPALFILFAFWLRVLRREFTNQYIPVTVTLVCLLLGSGSALSEIYRSLTQYSLQIRPMSSVSSLLNSPDNDVIQQRAGRIDAIYWRWLGPQKE